MPVQRTRLMSTADIERSLTRMSLEIVEKNHGIDNLALLGIHTGGVYLADRIHRMISRHEKKTIPLGSLDITLYRDDWSLVSQNPLVKKTDINFTVEDKRIVLIDDVLFTGRTVRAALDAIMDFGRPKTIHLAALVDRGGRELPIQADYVGLSVAIGEHQHIHVLLEEESECDEVVLLTH